MSYYAPAQAYDEWEAEEERQAHEMMRVQKKGRKVCAQQGRPPDKKCLGMGMHELINTNTTWKEVLCGSAAYDHYVRSDMT